MIDSNDIKPVKGRVVQKNISIESVLDLLIHILQHTGVEYVQVSGDKIEFGPVQVPCIILKVANDKMSELFKGFAITVMNDENGKLLGLSSIGESTLEILRASNGGDNEYVREQEHIGFWDMECKFYNFVYELFEAICNNI